MEAAATGDMSTVEVALGWGCVMGSAGPSLPRGCKGHTPPVGQGQLLEAWFLRCVCRQAWLQRLPSSLPAPHRGCRSGTAPSALLAPPPPPPPPPGLGCFPQQGRAPGLGSSPSALGPHPPLHRWGSPTSLPSWAPEPRCLSPWMSLPHCAESSSQGPTLALSHSSLLLSEFPKAPPLPACKSPDWASGAQPHPDSPPNSPSSTASLH